MFGFENIRIAFSGSVWLYIILAAILIAFSVFVYRYTLPKISNSSKILLTIIRSLIFALVLFLIFEPMLSLTKKTNNENSTLLLVDNSKSISSKDSLKRSQSILKMIRDLNLEESINVKLFSFGNKIDSLSFDQPTLNFDVHTTNYSSLLSLLNKHQSDASSAVLVSDGIITEGADPSYQLEKMQIPIFTVGVGDSSTKKDVELFNVSHNQYIYAETQTKIQATIRQNGFDGNRVILSFYEEDLLLESKEILLSNSGINISDFLYTPKTGGEKKLKISASPLTGEFTPLNNQKTFFITVLDTKLKIGLVAGSPSPDVSAIASALESDKNIKVNKFIQVSRDKIWDAKKVNALDSSSVLFLIDFPSSNTSQQLISQVASKIEKGTPFFISLSSSTDFGKLKALEAYLPFFTRNISPEAFQVLAEIQKNEFASNFSQLGNAVTVWNNLPPVFQSASEVIPKPESKVIVKSKVREATLNSPLIVLRSIGNQRSFAINANNYWRWSLQASERNPDFFKNFVNEIVKWLSLSGNKKQFNLSLNKKTYSANEQVEIMAELYDNSFNPVDTAQVKLEISHADQKNELILTPQGNGIYTGNFIPEGNGDFICTASTQLNGGSVLKSTTRFSVNSSSIELLDTKMRVDYLKLLANSSNGEYFGIENYDNLAQKLIDASKKKSSGTLIKNELELWNYSWILGLIVLLFATEWFLRKRFGMI
ncbi:MAG: vWA domain-containing protein [Melioribacteraceae bacterium]